MAALTPREIRERVQTVLEDDAGLIRSREAFSLNLQPNTVLDNSYTLDTERINERSQTNNVTARLDRLTVTVAKKLNMDSETAVRTLQDTLDDVDRRIRADGIDQGYHVWPGVLRITRPEGRDYCLGTLAWTCDYDYSEAVA